MSDGSDIVEALRDDDLDLALGDAGARRIRHDAADEIERLRRVCASLTDWIAGLETQCAKVVKAYNEQPTLK